MTHHSRDMAVMVRDFRHHGQSAACSTGGKSTLVTGVMILQVKPVTPVGTIGGHDTGACRRSARSEQKAHGGTSVLGNLPPGAMVTRLVSFDMTLEERLASTG